MAKNNHLSLRVDDKVLSFIDGFEGESRAEKFENLVRHCYERVPDVEIQLGLRKKQLTDLDAQISNKRIEILDLNKMGMYSHNLQSVFANLMETMRDYKSFVDQRM